MSFKLLKSVMIFTLLSVSSTTYAAKTYEFDITPTSEYVNENHTNYEPVSLTLSFKDDTDFDEVGKDDVIDLMFTIKGSTKRCNKIQSSGFVSEFFADVKGSPMLHLSPRKMRGALISCTTAESQGEPALAIISLGKSLWEEGYGCISRYTPPWNGGNFYQLFCRKDVVGQLK